MGNCSSQQQSHMGVYHARWGRYYDQGLVNSAITSHIKISRNEQNCLVYAPLKTDVRVKFEEAVNSKLRRIFIMLYVNKKDRDYFSNYRAIYLLCHAYKLLSAVISKRLHLKIELILSDKSTRIQTSQRYSRQRVHDKMDHQHVTTRMVIVIDYIAPFDHSHKKK